MVKVYIASPYSIGDKAANVMRQTAMASLLVSRGFAPFAPLLFTHVNSLCTFPESSWLEIDLEFLKACDCVLRLDGRSAGADLEVETAVKCGVPVFDTLDALCSFYSEAIR